MATPIVIKGETDEAVRTECARLALCEMAFLMATLDREYEIAKSDGSAAIGLELLWPLLTGRIEALNGVALSVVGNDINEDTQYLLDIVHRGEWLVDEGREVVARRRAA